MSQPTTQGTSDREPTNSAPVASRGPRDAVEVAERTILGIVLSEPARWSSVQQHVQPQDFTDAMRRRMAEVVWQHQRDEGETVFHEFLSVLNDAALTELAVELVDEAGELPNPQETLKDSVLHLAEVRRQIENKKLFGQLRRNDGQLGEQDEVSLLKKLQEQARTPNLRRV